MSQTDTASRPSFKEIRILVVGNSYQHTKSLIFLIGELVRLDPRIRATLVCSNSNYDKFNGLVSKMPVDLVSFESGGVPIESGSQRQVAGPGQVAPLFLGLLQPMVTTFKRTTLGFLLRECRLLARLKREKQVAESLFDKLTPDLVVAFGDRHPDFEAPILVVARERGIKVVIPYTSYSGKDILVEVRKNDPNYALRGQLSAYKKQIARRFRGQVHEGLFYQPPHMLAGYEKFGALSAYPWCLGNGLSDIICVDSEITAERYRRDRVIPEKIRIIGDVVYDKIADGYNRRREIRTELIKKYGFDEDMKIIVIALPQLAEQGLMDWESHWKEMRFLVDNITKTGQNILLSLHPRMNPKEYAFLEGEFACKIAQERLSEFISAADIFIANYSGTVIWAVLCGIRTVVVDFYGLNYNFYNYLTSVSIIRERDKLPPTLRALLETDEVDFSADWKALSRQIALDGRTIQRYLDLFLECAYASAMRKSMSVLN